MRMAGGTPEIADLKLFLFGTRLMWTVITGFCSPVVLVDTVSRIPRLLWIITRYVIGFCRFGAKTVIGLSKS